MDNVNNPPEVIDKLQIIKEFLERRKSSFKQGTDEWRNARTIGGSDTGTILGVNHFCDFRQWLADKIGCNYDDEMIVSRGGKKDIGFYKKPAVEEDDERPVWIPSGPNEAARTTIRTRWGKLFEEVVRDIAGQLYKLKSPIIGHDTFIIHDKHLCYSPDGLAVADVIEIARRFPQDEYLKGLVSAGEKEMVILFEFKCPLTRKIGRSVPEHYIAQPLTGMGIIDICNGAIFFESILRACSEEDLNFGVNYRRNFIFNDAPVGYRPQWIDVCKYDNKKVIVEAIGFIVFYSAKIEDDESISELLLKKMHVPQGEYLKLGDDLNNTRIISILLGAADCGEISTYYSPAILRRDESEASKLDIAAAVQKIRDDGCIVAAVLPWKLIKFGEHFMQRDDSIFNMVDERAKMIYDAILRAKAAEDDESKLDIIDEVYAVIKEES